MALIGKSLREDVVFLLGGLILLATCLGALRAVHSRQLLARLRSAVRRCKGGGARPEEELRRVVQAKLQQQKVEHFRRTCQIFCLSGVVFTGYHMLIIATAPVPRIYSLAQDVVHLSVHGLSVLICFRPGILVWKTMDVFYFVFVAGLAVWLLPIPSFREGTFMFSLVFGNLLITLLTLVRRSLPTISSGNFLFGLAASSLIYQAPEDYIPRPRAAVFLQCLFLVLLSGGAHFFEASVEAMIQQSVEVEAAKEMLSAVSALLRSCCDVVEKLDSAGRISSLGIDLGGFLLRGPDRCLQGWHLSDLMPLEEDRQKFSDALTTPRSAGLAEAMNVRMKDGNGDTLQLELLLIQFCHLGEQAHFVVGLREFSDVPVCRWQGNQQAHTVHTSAERMATSTDEESSFSLPESIPVVTDSLEEAVAMAVVDSTKEGFPIQACSPGFLARFGRVGGKTKLLGLVKDWHKFEKWVQQSLNILISDGCEPPDIRITLNMPQGPVRAACRIGFTHEEGDDENQFTIDITNLRIMFSKLSRYQTESAANSDTKGTPLHFLSL